MDNQPIIIKKVKKVVGHAHHGGSWKVAYADFVTAMMAFFLLLWLLNVTTDVQKKGIADFFSPASLSQSNSGAGGVLGGQSVIVDGSKVSDAGAVSIAIEAAPRDSQSESEKNADPTNEDIAKKIAERETEAYQRTEAALRAAIRESAEAEQLARHLIIDMTPEGLRIQLIDQDNQSMFPSGSAVMNERSRILVKTIAKVVEKIPNKLSLSGHTDALAYRSENGYTNWELSSDRANASRRALVEAGVPAARFRLVSGKADQEPLVPENPLAPSNRRISLVLLRDQPAKAAPEGPGPAPAPPTRP
jgi:chemotaxis protein MotB